MIRLENMPFYFRYMSYLNYIRYAAEATIIDVYGFDRCSSTAINNNTRQPFKSIQQLASLSFLRLINLHILDGCSLEVGLATNAIQLAAGNGRGLPQRRGRHR